MAVNVVGSLALGLFVGYLARRSGSSNELRLFVATGVLGGFTTFSAFSLDVATLWERGAPFQPPVMRWRASWGPSLRCFAAYGSQEASADAIGPLRNGKVNNGWR
jgi:fluoride ion exporter CrcB/FEX